MEIIIHDIDNDGAEYENSRLFRISADGIPKGSLSFEALTPTDDPLGYDLNYHIVKKLRDTFDHILQNCHDQKSFEEFIKLSN